MIRLIRLGLLSATLGLTACGEGSSTTSVDAGADSSDNTPAATAKLQIPTSGRMDSVFSAGNASGDMITVWRDYDAVSDHDALKFNVFDPVTGWGSAQTIPGSPGVEKNRVYAALDVNSNGVIAWLGEDRVMAVYVVNGVVIHTHVLDSNSAHDFGQFYARVVANSNGSGQFAFAWLAGSADNTLVKVATCKSTNGCLLQSTPSTLRKSDQAKWDALNVANGTQLKGVVNVASFDLAFDSASNLVVIWSGEARYSLELDDGYFITGGYNGLNISLLPPQFSAQWSDPINLVVDNRNTVADIGVNLALQGAGGVVAIADGALVGLSDLAAPIPTMTPISVDITQYEQLGPSQRFRLLAMDDSGNAWHMWRCSSDGGLILELCAGRYEGGQWQFSSIAEPQNATVAAAANASGDIIVIWETSQSYRARTFNADTKMWSTPFDVDQEKLFGPTALSVALSDDGLWHAVWMRTYVDENNNSLARFQEKLFSKRGKIQ